MFEFMLTLHLLAVVFAVGPLVHATTTAVRGVRSGDAFATASAARWTKVYSYASVLAVIFGFGLMSATSPYSGEPVASFAETWIWLSSLLWLIGVVIALVVTTPALKKAPALISANAPLDRFTVKIAASGGLIGIIFAAVIVLMVYQPGG